jgi:RHS repeat-associated protein
LRVQPPKIASRARSAHFHNSKPYNGLPILPRHPPEPPIPQGHVQRNGIEDPECSFRIPRVQSATRLLTDTYEFPDLFKVFGVFSVDRGDGVEHLSPLQNKFVLHRPEFFHRNRVVHEQRHEPVLAIAAFAILRDQIPAFGDSLFLAGFRQHIQLSPDLLCRIQRKRDEADRFGNLLVEFLLAHVRLRTSPLGLATTDVSVPLLLHLQRDSTAAFTAPNPASIEKRLKLRSFVPPASVHHTPVLVKECPAHQRLMPIRTRKETWTLNQAGGWATFTSDLNGDGSFSSPAFGPGDEKNETRTFSVVNEMLTRVNNGVTKSPAFNANGQKTDDGVNYAYEWDAFGRLRKVKNRSNSALVVEYTYNGLNQQIGRHADLDADGDVDSTDKWEWTIYDPRWRRVATYMVAGGSTFGGAADSDPKERYIHHAAGRSGGGSYLDSVILRDRDQTAGNNGAADGTLEQRLYYGQNWRADVSVLMTSTGRILERLTYSSYGVATRHPVADFNRDGIVDFFDDADYDDCYIGNGCPAGQTADLNLDGVADMFDYDEWDLSYAEQVNTARGVLSQNDASAAVNRLGYAGYFFEPATQQYLVRNREYDPNTGVWDERDPMGYHDGADLYMHVGDNPITGRDPMGLLRSNCGDSEQRCSGSTPSQSAVAVIDRRYPSNPLCDSGSRASQCRTWAQQECARGHRARAPSQCQARCIDTAVACCVGENCNAPGMETTCKNKGLAELSACWGTFNSGMSWTDCVNQCVEQAWGPTCDYVCGVQVFTAIMSAIATCGSACVSVCSSFPPGCVPCWKFCFHELIWGIGGMAAACGSCTLGVVSGCMYGCKYN